MLIDKDLANIFLDKYKDVMRYINGGNYPTSIEEYAKLRPVVFERIDEVISNYQEVVGPNFINSLKSAILGTFVYLKKYRKGYILQYIETGTYYQVSALNTPLEEITAEYSVIETAIFSLEKKLVCDGLIVSNNMIVGKNMAKEIRDGYWKAKRSGELVVNA